MPRQAFGIICSHQALPQEPERGMESPVVFACWFFAATRLPVDGHTSILNPWRGGCCCPSLARTLYPSTSYEWLKRDHLVLGKLVLICNRHLCNLTDCRASVNILWTADIVLGNERLLQSDRDRGCWVLDHYFHSMKQLKELWTCWRRRYWCWTVLLPCIGWGWPDDWPRIWRR